MGSSSSSFALGSLGIGQQANTGRGALRETVVVGDNNNNNSIELLSKYVVSQLKKLPLD